MAPAAQGAMSTVLPTWQDGVTPIVASWDGTVMISGQITIIHQPESFGHLGMISLINHDFSEGEQ